MGVRGPGAKPIKLPAKSRAKRPRKRAWERKGLTRAGRVIAFIEGLRLTAGKHAGKPLLLRPWQREFIEAVYATDSEGRRPIRQALMSVARKNGKTQLCAALALCHLAGPEAEPRGEVYSAASDRNQAARIFREMLAAIQHDPDLDGRIHVKNHEKRLEVVTGPGAGSAYEALSSDARKAHGLSPSFIVADEIAQWHGRDLYDNLISGIGARDEPLAVAIGTQSADPNQLMTELVAYGRHVLDGTIDDPTFHAAIYTVPDDADPWDESLWPLANPALGDFRSLQEMREFAAKAKRIPAREAVFRNLYLNQSIATEARFIAAADWRACAAPVDREALRGRPCYGGLDLSSTTDLTSLSLYFPEDGGAVLNWSWLPAHEIAERELRDRVPYRQWEELGFLELTPGRAINKRHVAQRLAAITAEFDVCAVGYDRWRVADLKVILDEEGIEVTLEEIGMGYQSQGPALDALETAILDGSIAHGGNPVLTWCAGNAVVTSDPAGNRKLDKARSTARIDALISLALAKGIAAKRPVEGSLSLSDLITVVG